jgi:hypothetical protein
MVLDRDSFTGTKQTKRSKASTDESFVIRTTSQNSGPFSNSFGSISQCISGKTWPMSPACSENSWSVERRSSYNLTWNSSQRRKSAWNWNSLLLNERCMITSRPSCIANSKSDEVSLTWAPIPWAPLYSICASSKVTLRRALEIH